MQPAEPEMSNRVVRHFCRQGFQPRDFVRVSCGEEDGRKLYSPTGSDELSAVYANVQAILNDGEITNHHPNCVQGRNPSVQGLIRDCCSLKKHEE